MGPSGYVLAGGISSRMGRDKALLPYRGTTLLEQVARAVREAAGEVALIGDPSKYSGLGYPVYPDRVPGCGPLGGVYTALCISTTDWNMVVACDMPAISTDVLRSLLHTAEESGKDCVFAAGPDGSLEPLCAVYHRRCLPAVALAIEQKRFKMKELVGKLDALAVSVPSVVLTNVNTPEEWAGFPTKAK